jgi:hydroxylaminobenzene mutase
VGLLARRIHEVDQDLGGSVIETKSPCTVAESTDKDRGGVMDRKLIRHGFVLIAAALGTGFVIPTVELPRLALSAHTIGVLGGVLLTAVGAVWRRFDLSDGQRRTMYIAWLYSSYVNWLAVLVGSVLGTGKLTPVASAGAIGPPVAEAVVSAALVSVGVASLVAVGIAVWGLRGAEAAD